MKYKVTGTWKTKVPVKVVDETGRESVEHFIAEFVEIGRGRMMEIERDRRRRVRRQIELRRQTERLERRLDDLYGKGESEKIRHVEHDLEELKRELEKVEEAAASSDVTLLDEFFVAAHQLEVTGDDGNLLGSAETRALVMDHVNLLVPTAQAFIERVSRAAEKNSGKSGAS